MKVYYVTMEAIDAGSSGAPGWSSGFESVVKHREALNAIIALRESTAVAVRRIRDLARLDGGHCGDRMCEIWHSLDMLLDGLEVSPTPANSPKIHSNEISLLGEIERGEHLAVSPESGALASEKSEV